MQLFYKSFSIYFSIALMLILIIKIYDDYFSNYRQNKRPLWRLIFISCLLSFFLAKRFACRWNEDEHLPHFCPKRPTAEDIKDEFFEALERRNKFD